MARITKKQREFLKAAYAIWPECREIDKLKPIKIHREGTWSATLESNVEEYLGSQATLVREERIPSHPFGILKCLLDTKGIVFGIEKKEYGVGDKGKILYESVDAIGHYIGTIRPVGFDVKDPAYQKLRRGVHRVVKKFDRLVVRMNKQLESSKQ